jgi:hypothetical protein
LTIVLYGTSSEKTSLLDIEQSRTSCPTALMLIANIATKAKTKHSLHFIFLYFVVQFRARRLAFVKLKHPI